MSPGFLLRHELCAICQPVPGERLHTSISQLHPSEQQSIMALIFRWLNVIVRCRSKDLFYPHADADTKDTSRYGTNGVGNEHRNVHTRYNKMPKGQEPYRIAQYGGDHMVRCTASVPTPADERKTNALRERKECYYDEFFHGQSVHPPESQVAYPARASKMTSLPISMRSSMMCW